MKTLPETLITITENCPAKRGIEPTTSRAGTTITMHYHDLFIETPYCFTYEQAKREVHKNRRGKIDLKLTSYDMRSELCKVWGWGARLRVVLRMVCSGENVSEGCS